LINALEDLMPDSDKYQDYAQKLTQEKTDQRIRKTLYISRRAIWVNVLLAMLISPMGSYIYTRRWKALGIFAICSVAIGMVLPTNIEDGDSFQESFVKGLQEGIALSPLFGVAAAIENGLAIHRARQTVANGAKEDA
jgi:ATP/ADP translocase